MANQSKISRPITIKIPFKPQMNKPITIKVPLDSDTFLWLYEYNKGWTREDLQNTLEKLIDNFLNEIRENFESNDIRR